MLTITRRQKWCDNVCDPVDIWTISWARFSPYCVINLVIHSAFTLSPVIKHWSSIVSSCTIYGKRRENVDGYFNASGDVKITSKQSETSLNKFSLFNELNK